MSSTFEPGTLVHLRWTIEQHRPPLALAYTVVYSDPTTTGIRPAGKTTVFSYPTRMLVEAGPDPDNWRPAERFEGMLNFLKDPAGRTEQFRKYQASKIQPTPRELENLKQAGLRPLFAAMYEEAAEYIKVVNAQRAKAAQALAEKGE